MQEFWIYMFIEGEYVKCAKLSVSEQGFQLKYNDEYLQSDEMILIDPQNLGPYSKSFFSEDLFGAIRDSAPDYWGRELLNRKFQVSELNELEYVFANNLEHVGALAYSPVKYDVPMKLEKSGWVPHKSKKIEIEQIIEQTELMIKDIDGVKLKELFEYGPTLGGGRPKVSLYFEDELYLAKYGTSLDSTPEQKIEYATMKMAKDLGLNVPKIRLSRHLERDVFMIQRFDRKNSKRGMNRLHFISALSLCNWHEYGTRDWSYPVLAEHIKKSGNTSEQIALDLKELYRRIAFNIAVNNNDDHPRNHGLLYEKGAWRLSPLYDVVPKAIRGETFTMAMTIGVYEREASKRNLLSSAKYFGLDESAAEKIIDETNDFIENKWRLYFKNAGLSQSVIKQFVNSIGPK